MICIPTPTGSVTIGRTITGTCDLCGLPSLEPGVAPVHVTIAGAAQPELLICGQCLLTGLAIAAGRHHVLQGGDVADLQLPNEGGIRP